MSVNLLPEIGFTNNQLHIPIQLKLDKNKPPIYYLKGNYSMCLFLQTNIHIGYLVTLYKVIGDNNAITNADTNKRHNYDAGSNKSLHYLASRISLVRCIDCG